MIRVLGNLEPTARTKAPNISFTTHVCHFILTRTRHSHVDVVPLDNAAQVLIGGKDSMKSVVVNVRHNHLDGQRSGEMQ